MTFPYEQETELHMQEFYNRLPEKSRRLYAGVEASKLGRGGISYITRLFCCSRNTILRGIKELGEKDMLDPGSNRKKGGGRSSILKKQVEINTVFLHILKNHTAGDPMDEDVKWTNLTNADITSLLAKEGFKVSRNIVRQLLKKHGYVKRKALKKSLLENM